MTYSVDNLKSCLAVTQEAYTQWRDELGADGFRTISLSLAGPVSTPTYTAVMAKSTPPFHGRSFPRLSLNELKNTIAELAAETRPLHPYVIAATGPRGQAIYAVAFREMTSAPIVGTDCSPDEFRAAHTTQRTAGRILLWMDSFGTPEAVRYCAIWGSNPDHVAWAASDLDDDRETRQARFDALVAIGARPALCTMTAKGHAVPMYVDDRLKHRWVWKASMSAASMQEALEDQRANNFFPVRLGTAVVDNALRFSAIFAKSDEIVSRTQKVRVRGPVPEGLDQTDQTKTKDLDNWMENYLRAHGMRGAALAIVEGTRLVYAKGYTFAEPDYPDIEPTTLFRMASVSKAFCAVTVWKALLDDPQRSRSSTMQSILGLKQLDGSAPADSRFAAITVRHLLESCSGIDRLDQTPAMRDSMADIKRGNGAQPASRSTLASLVAARTMNASPGGPTVYGRTDYWLLGLIAAKLAGVADFHAALKKLVLDPLHMTRTRGSDSHIENRATDEALQHTRNLRTTTSATHNDRRIVLEQYGGENYGVFDGAGGISSAVIDVARLCAMFSCRIANPVLPAHILQAMLEDAVAATAAGSDHGYHGFDSATGSDTTFTIEKRGTLPGAGGGFKGTTGRRFIVIARNGDGVEGATPGDWRTDLHAIAATIDWKGVDLFPSPFGMPALGITTKQPAFP